MGTNNFVALPVIPAGLNQPSESAAVDLYAVVPPNGFSPNGVSVILSGNFTGVIALVGSLDGVNYRPLTEGFNAGAQTDPSRPFSLEFPPQLFTDLVRYVKWKVLKNTKILTNVSITLGGELNCDCATGGDGKILITGADTTPGYASAKIVAGTNTTLTVLNPGANETLQINASAGFTTKYSVDFSTLANQTLTDGAMTIDGKTWHVENVGQSTSFQVINGTGLQMIAAGGNPAGAVTRTASPLIVGVLTDLNASLAEFERVRIWSLNTYTVVANFNFIRWAVENYQSIYVANDSVYTGILRGTGAFNYWASEVLQNNAGLFSANDVTDLADDVTVIEYRSPLTVYVYSGASVAGNFPAFSALRCRAVISLSIVGGTGGVPGKAATNLAFQLTVAGNLDPLPNCSNILKKMLIESISI